MHCLRWKLRYFSKLFFSACIWRSACGWMPWNRHAGRKHGRIRICERISSVQYRIKGSVNSIYRAYSDFTNCPYQTMHRFVCTQSLFINHKQFTIYPIGILWLVVRGYIISCFAYICIIRQENFDVNSFCLSGRIFAPEVKIWQKITLILFWIRVILNCVFVQLNTFYRL